MILTTSRGDTEEMELLGDSPTQSHIIPVGTIAFAQIATSIIWAQGMESSDPFVVTLSEPISDLNGIEVLPEGTEIIFLVDQIHDSGMVIGDAIAIRLDGQEMELPRGVFALRAPGGKPLIAVLRNDARGDIARRDAMGFVVGALGKVGEVVNRPTSTSSSSGFGGFSQSSTYDSPNITGAVLEGGFEPLSEQMKRRNEREIDELQDRERLWYLKDGTKVQIQVNRLLEL
ncbi:TrbI/VirB10 family protein [Gloeothece citriformis]|nr:TrbI/VirB10 family protein [Gloeothece citriformis]